MKERLILVAKALNITPSRFSRSIGKSDSYVRTLKGNPGLDVVIAILRNYPSVNPVWLLMGEGEMFLKNEGVVDYSLLYDQTGLYTAKEGQANYIVHTEECKSEEIDKLLKSKEEIINSQKKTIEAKDELIDLLKLQIKKMSSDN